MTDYPAVQPISIGAVAVEQSGTVSGDTVPAGCCLLVRNTGAGTHHIVLGVNYQFDGMSPQTVGAAAGTRQITLTAAQNQVVRVPASYGDANGRVAFTVLEATYSEIKYTVIGA